MAILTVKPTYGGLSGTGSLEGIREYVKSYTVLTDSADDGVMAIGNHASLPKKGDVYTWNGETDAGALCYSVEPRQDPTVQTVWYVTCNFSSNIGGTPGGFVRGDPSRDVDNPLTRPLDITLGNWSETVLVTHDANDQPILNPLGIEYSPPLQKTIKRRSLIIVRNEASIPAAIADEYEGTVNSDDFYDGPPGTVSLENVTATAHFDQGMFYWRVRYEFKHRKEGWIEEVLRQGTVYREKVYTSEFIWEWQDVLPSDKDGVYHTNLVLLNEDGEKLTKDEIDTRRAVPKGTPGGLFDLYQIREAKPYSVLNL